MRIAHKARVRRALLDEAVRESVVAHRAAVEQELGVKAEPAPAPEIPATNVDWERDEREWAHQKALAHVRVCRKHGCLYCRNRAWDPSVPRVREGRMTIDSLDVLAALSHLTENQREALIDSVVLHRTEAEIAETMGCTRQNVQNHKRAALDRLRALDVFALAA